jgi:hypothetical protein
MTTTRATPRFAGYTSATIAGYVVFYYAGA